MGRSFDRFRAEELEAEGLLDAPLCLSDAAFVSGPILRAFLAGASGKPSRLALPMDSRAVAPFAPVSSIEQAGELFLLDVFAHAPGETLEALRASTSPVVVRPEVPTARRELPRLGPAPHHIDLPCTGLVAAQVEHWVHVLWLWPALVPRLIVRSHPKTRARTGLMENVVGAGAVIHPTATVEGSIIGPGAEIGPFASVRNSYVGAGSKLSDFTKLTSSVFEAKTHTLADASFSSVVSLGESTLASLLLRDTILGRAVFLTTGVIFWNEGHTEPVQVEHRGRWHDTKRLALGGCAGHGASLGARTIVAPGRALPNGAVVVMRREEGVMRVTDAPAGTPMCWDDAALVPYDSLRPGETPDELV